jgi:hypothetical protein
VQTSFAAIDKIALGNRLGPTNLDEVSLVFFFFFFFFFRRLPLAPPKTKSAISQHVMFGQ